jgi:hypothetical protein
MTDAQLRAIDGDMATAERQYLSAVTIAENGTKTGEAYYLFAGHLGIALDTLGASCETQRTGRTMRLSITRSRWR